MIEWRININIVIKETTMTIFRAYPKLKNKHNDVDLSSNEILQEMNKSIIDLHNATMVLSFIMATLTITLIFMHAMAMGLE